MKLVEIKEVLECGILTGDEMLSLDIETVVASDGMSEILACPCEGALKITGLVNIQSVRTADVAGVAGVVYVRGKAPEDKVIALAREKGLPVLSTRYGMFDVCGILREKGLIGVS